MPEKQISDHFSTTSIPRLSREVLKTLEIRSDFHGFLACSRVAFALLLCWFALARFGLVSWTSVPIFIAIGTLQHHLFIIQHEALHFYLFKNRAANEFFGGLAGLLVGFP